MDLYIFFKVEEQIKLIPSYLTACYANLIFFPSSKVIIAALALFNFTK
jgi:hypothetical protein